MLMGTTVLFSDERAGRESPRRQEGELVMGRHFRRWGKPRLLFGERCTESMGWRLAYQSCKHSWPNRELSAMYSDSRSTEGYLYRDREEECGLVDISSYR